MATIRDVARRAGVSTAAVSYVLNNKKRLNPDTMQRVLVAARELDYSPNLSARTLVTSVSKVVYTIITDVMDPFFSPIVRGVENELNSRGYSLLVGSSDEDRDRLLTYLRNASGLQAAGVVISPPSCIEDLAGTFSGLGIPVIQVNRWSRLIESDAVISDNEDAMYRATKHVLDLGHRDVALIVGPQNVSTYITRLAGFRRAMLERMPASRIERCVHYCETSNSEIAYQVAHRVVNGDDRPTAIIGGGSGISKGVYQALLEVGVDIPVDISFVGYDIGFWSALVRPSLTEVRQQNYEIGRQAGALLLERLSDPKAPVRVRTLGAEVFIGDSTAPPRRTNERGGKNESFG